MFEIVEPKNNKIAKIPVIFNSPHSGRGYEKEFLRQTQLDNQEIRLSEDAWVDKLIEDMGDMGAIIMKAEFPRAWLDVNREPYELDPLLFWEKIPDFANTQSDYVKMGLGTIPRIVEQNRQIYENKISIKDAMDRIQNFYLPYHQALEKLIEETHKEFNYAVLVDCHSMPSSPQKPDFILGDLHKTSCDEKIVLQIKNELEKIGYKVACNQFYAGGYITKKYGKPKMNKHAVQIEINRGLYMNEKTMEMKPEFFQLKENLQQVFNNIFFPLAIAAQ